MCIYLYTNIYINIYIYKYKHVHMYTYTHIHVCTYIILFTCTNMINVHMFKYVSHKHAKILSLIRIPQFDAEKAKNTNKVARLVPLIRFAVEVHTHTLSLTHTHTQTHTHTHTHL